MIVKTYYQDGRTDAFDRGNVVTNWLLDLSGAMCDSGILPLSIR